MDTKFLGSFSPVGEQAVQVTFPALIDAEVNQFIHELVGRISSRSIVGVQTTIPAYHTLTVLFDREMTDYHQVVTALRELMAVGPAVGNKKKQQVLELPVCYDEAFGWDLAQVAAHTKLSVADVVKMHSKQDYLIYMMGFMPGFAYMGALPESLYMPRRETPRIEVPAGSIGIAGYQTGMYPIASPGGWRILGRTPITLYHPDRPLPLYQAGDSIRFQPISKAEFDRIYAQEQKK